jgi:hypothetical protein
MTISFSLGFDAQAYSRTLAGGELALALSPIFPLATWG